MLLTCNSYISYRQSYSHHPSKRVRFEPAPRQNGRFDPDSESAGLLADTNDAVIEMDVLPPRWLDVQDEITQRLTTITTQMKKLDQLHAKHVLPGFDDESVKMKEERDIEALTHDITKSFTSCQNAIRRIDKMVKEQGSTNEEGTLARNLGIALASRVGEVSTTFRKKQSAYLKRLRALGGMSTALEAGRNGTPSQAGNPYMDPAMEDSEMDRSSAQSTLQQTAQVRRRTGAYDAQIVQREREIESIAQGVIDLSNIFQEIQSMVIDQGSLLDRIDYNVDRTVEHLQKADKELKVATNYQRRSTKRKIILLLILLVAGVFILLFIKPKRSSQPAASLPEPVEPGLPPVAALTVRGKVDDELRWEWKQRRRRQQ